MNPDQEKANRAVNRFRRGKLLARKHEELGHDLDARAEEPRAAADPDDALDDAVGDDRLRLVFTACHPVLSPEARAALTLRLLGGLGTAEIARAFLVPETTMAQRIVRAKRALADAGVRFEVPRRAELPARLSSVLEVVSLIIAELYAELAALAPSPIVELNRAMAVSMAHGAAAGLAIVDAIAAEPTLRAIRSCRPRAPISSSSSAGSTRRASSSSAPRP